MHIGSTFYVKETGDSNYIANVVVTVNGQTSTDNTIPVNNTGGSGVDTGTVKIIGALQNSAAFTNARTDTSPTGLNLVDLPFIGLVVLALAGMAVLVVLAGRRSRNNS